MYCRRAAILATGIRRALPGCTITEQANKMNTLPLKHKIDGHAAGLAPGNGGAP
jgi:hypothetical protein